MNAHGHWLRVVGASLCIGLVGCGGSFDPEETAAPAQPARPAPVSQFTAPAAVPVPASPPSAARSMASTTDQLAARVARLEAEVAALRLARGAAPHVGAAASPAATTDKPEAPEAAFQREETDPAWSRTAAQQVQQAVGQADPGLYQRLQTVECRSRQCRLAFAPGDDGIAVEASLPGLITELDNTFVYARTQSMDAGAGRLGTVLFLFR